MFVCAIVCANKRTFFCHHFGFFSMSSRRDYWPRQRKMNFGCADFIPDEECSLCSGGECQKNRKKVILSKTIIVGSPPVEIFFYCFSFCLIFFSVSAFLCFAFQICPHFLWAFANASKWVDEWMMCLQCTCLDGEKKKAKHALETQIKQTCGSKHLDEMSEFCSFVIVFFCNC